MGRSVLSHFQARPFEVLVLGVITALASLSWGLWLKSPVFPLDDAYIVQHAAQGVLSDGEHRFPGATPMDGSTSPFHLLTIVLLSHWMPIPWAQWAVATSAVVLYLCGIVVLAAQFHVSRFNTWILIVLAAVGGSGAFQLLNGLETTLAMGVVTWALIFLKDPTPNRIGAFLIGTMPFVRPELGALSLLLVVRWVLVTSRSDRGLMSRPI